MRKIGIMGGTFNPIHNGHIALAQAAYEFCELDEVWFMPSGVSYLKKNDKIASGQERFEMTSLAVEDISYLILTIQYENILKFYAAHIRESKADFEIPR